MRERQGRSPAVLLLKAWVLFFDGLIPATRMYRRSTQEHAQTCLQPSVYAGYGNRWKEERIPDKGLYGRKFLSADGLGKSCRPDGLCSVTSDPGEILLAYRFLEWTSLKKDQGSILRGRWPFLRSGKLIRPRAARPESRHGSVVALLDAINMWWPDAPRRGRRGDESISRFDLQSTRGARWMIH